MKLFKNDLFKRSAVLLIAVLMMLTYCMPVFADDVDDDEELVEWFVSDDYQTVSGNGKEYKLFDTTYFDGYLDARNVFCFEDDIGLGEICATSKDSEIIWMSDYNGFYVYATDEGFEILARFAKGQNISFRFEDFDYYQTDIVENKLMEAIDKEASASFVQTKEIDVSLLRDVPRYDVLAYDETHTFARIYGAIYYIDTDYYYVNYGKLEVNYFDADGNFSYNPGPNGRKVVLSKLGNANAGAVATVLQTLDEFLIEYTYEQEYFFPLFPEELGVGAFWVSYSIIGFAAPIPFIVIGAVFANSKKRGRKKSWYILTAIGSAYLICAIALAILLAV